MLQSKLPSRSTKIKVYKEIKLPNLIYSAVIKTINKSDRENVVFFERYILQNWKKVLEEKLQQGDYGAVWGAAYCRSDLKQ